MLSLLYCLDCSFTPPPPQGEARSDTALARLRRLFKSSRCPSSAAPPEALFRPSTLRRPRRRVLGQSLLSPPCFDPAHAGRRLTTATRCPPERSIRSNLRACPSIRIGRGAPAPAQQTQTPYSRRFNGRPTPEHSGRNKHQKGGAPFCAPKSGESTRGHCAYMVLNALLLRSGPSGHSPLELYGT